MHQYRCTERLKKNSHWREVLRWCQANTVEVKQGGWKGRQKKAESWGSETSQCLRCFSEPPESAKRRWWGGGSGLYHEILHPCLHCQENKLIYENKNKREIKWGGEKRTKYWQCEFWVITYRGVWGIIFMTAHRVLNPTKGFWFFSAAWHNIIQTGQNEVTRSK